MIHARRRRTSRVIGAAALALAAAAAIRAGAQDAGGTYQAELERGRAALQGAQPEQAIQAFKRAAKSPDDKDAAMASLGMAVAYQRLGQYKNAVESCDSALERTRGDRDLEAEIRNARGTALAAMAKGAGDKKLTEAEAEFRAAVAASDALSIARFNLGTTLMRLNRDEEGIQVLKEFLQRETNGPHVRDARRLIENPNRARVPYAPDFSFTSRQGEQISLAGLQGKAILLDFWGSWCGPCVQAAPGLARLAKKFNGSPVVFLGIAQDKRDDWEKFIEKHNLDWPQYLDETREIADLFGVTGYPTYIIVDTDGVMRSRRMGYGNGTDSWIESELKKALKTK